MKFYNQITMLVFILSLSACQAGKVTSEKISNIEVQALASTPSTSSIINLGSLTSGLDLSVQPNATPIPTPVPVLSTSTHGTSGPIVVSEVLDLPSSDTHQIYTSSMLQSKLAAVLGSEFAADQNIYQNYAVTLASNSNTQVPSVLSRMVSLSFLSSNGKTANLTVSLVKLLAPYASVITYGTTAYYGIGLIPAANSSFSAVPFTSLTAPIFFKIGSALQLMGGLNGNSPNRMIATITFSANKFLVSPSLSSFASVAGLVKIIPKPVSAEVAVAAGLAQSHVGYHLLVAFVNSSNKIFLLNLLNVSTGVITTASASCSSVVNFFPGYTCQVVTPTPSPTPVPTPTVVPTPVQTPVPTPTPVVVTPGPTISPPCNGGGVSPGGPNEFTNIIDPCIGNSL